MAVENVLGLTFLYASIVDCGKMIDAMKGCVGSFDECVLPILTAEEVAACGLRSDENAEYAEWANTCGPRGDPITVMVVAPSAVSLGMTVVFTAMFFIRSAKRIRVRTAPLAQLRWKRLSELELKAMLRAMGQPNGGTKEELADRVSKYVAAANTETALAKRYAAPEQADDAPLDETHEPEPMIGDVGDRKQLEDKSKLAIAHEELEKMKLQDTAFETLVFILAIALFAYKIQPMLMQKEGVGCGAHA